MYWPGLKSAGVLLLVVLSSFQHVTLGYIVTGGPIAVVRALRVGPGARMQSRPVFSPAPLSLRMQEGAGTASVSDSAAADRESLKNAFISAALAGPKNGVDATPEQRETIESKLEDLIKFNPTKEPAYAMLRPPYEYFDGTFEMLYTNTAGGSSGKLGAFVGDVTQTFLGIRDNDAMGFSRRGIFTNNVQITFEETNFSLFGFPVKKKEFEIGAKGSKGTWDMLYMDSNLRVLKTNAGNYMVLKRGTPEGGESWMERQNRLGSAPL